LEWYPQQVIIPCQWSFESGCFVSFSSRKATFGNYGPMPTRIAKGASVAGVTVRGKRAASARSVSAICRRPGIGLHIPRGAERRCGYLISARGLDPTPDSNAQERAEGPRLALWATVTRRVVVGPHHRSLPLRNVDAPLQSFQLSCAGRSTTVPICADSAGRAGHVEGMWNGASGYSTLVPIWF
jgi:hypothetical protein